MVGGWDVVVKAIGTWSESGEEETKLAQKSIIQYLYK